MAERLRKITLVGNPNCGKSSIFNALTGLNQKVGNYPGVTVDKRTGQCVLPDGEKIELTDLPGSYSIYPKSKDEEIVFDILIDQLNPDHPDGIIAVLDASNLKRNLLFCSQVVDLGIPMIVVVSMTDLANKAGQVLDLQVLEQELGVTVVAVNARKMSGIKELKEAMQRGFRVASKAFCKVRGKQDVFVDEATPLFPGATPYRLLQYALHADAIRFLPADKLAQLTAIANRQKISKAAVQAEETLTRYRQINGLVDRIMKQERPLADSFTDKADNLLTHRVWGYVMLVIILFVVFQAIFSLAEYPMLLVENGSMWLSQWLLNTLPAGWGTDLLVNGVLAGISGVVVFIPQIAILFGFLTIMEDTGYMARVSFLTDRLMRSVGLNGKSVIPLMSGMACAIPAVMAARNIGNWKERLITILVTPLMSCSARLPVYTLIISLVIPDQYVLGVVNLQGLTLLGLYLLGLFTAMAVAWVLSRLITSSDRSFFLLEMPIYRSPRWKNVGITMYEKAKIFTLEAGKVILLISIILWFLSSYGPADIGWGTSETDATEVAQLDESSLQLRESFAGHFGRFIEPAIQPLGFDWKMGIALITSFAAREVFVGTMATIYSVEADEDDFDTVRQHMRNDTYRDGTPVYTFATGLSLLIFFAFAMQCMSTLAIVRRETQTWKWAMVQLGYMTGLAYAASLITYQLLA